MVWDITEFMLTAREHVGAGAGAGAFSREDLPWNELVEEGVEKIHKMNDDKLPGPGSGHPTVLQEL